MKAVRYTLGFLLLLVLLIIGLALLQPNHYSVSRSILIKAAPEKIYSLIATPRSWKNWSVWNQRDPAMQMQFSGPDSGQNAAWEWKSKTQGNGGMRFTSAIANRELAYELHFEGMGKPSTGTLRIEKTGDGCTVLWDMQGSTEGNLMMKLFQPFMDRMVGSDFDAGLKNLRKIVEQAP